MHEPFGLASLICLPIGILLGAIGGIRVAQWVWTLQNSRAETLKALGKALKGFR
jgi:hypothetical protein